MYFILQKYGNIHRNVIGLTQNKLKIPTHSITARINSDDIQCEGKNGAQQMNNYNSG